MKDQMKFGKKRLSPDFMNVYTLVSWERLTIGVRFFFTNWSHLNSLSIGIISYENCQSSIFTDRKYWRKLSRLGRFPKMTLGRKMFFDLSIFDIQWENKGDSIYQILQNNDLPQPMFQKSLFMKEWDEKSLTV